MIKDVFEAIAAAARKLFGNWGALLLSLLLYVTLLATVGFFFTTHEATLLEVALTFVVLPLFALLLFFAWQTMGVSYVRIGVGAGYLFKRAMKDCWMLLVVSLPLILLAWGILYVTGKAEAKFITEAEKPQRWIVLSLTWIPLFLLGFLLPLAAIHLWMTTVREGVKSAYQNFFRAIKQAFELHSVLIYVVLQLAFGALAWVVFFKEIHLNNNWGELLLAGMRFALGCLFLFFGWMLTLGAMAEMTTQRAMRDALDELEM